MNDKTKDGLKLGSMISLLVGVISLIVVIPTITMIMGKLNPQATNPSMEYQVVDTIVIDELVIDDFVMSTTTTSGGEMEVYTYQTDNFTFVVNDMNGATGVLPSFTQTSLINDTYYPYILYAKTTNTKESFYLTDTDFRYIPKNTGIYSGTLLNLLTISDFKVIQFI